MKAWATCSDKPNRICRSNWNTKFHLLLPGLWVFCFHRNHIKNHTLVFAPCSFYSSVNCISSAQVHAGCSSPTTTLALKHFSSRMHAIKDGYSNEHIWYVQQKLSARQLNQYDPSLPKTRPSSDRSVPEQKWPLPASFPPPSRFAEAEHWNKVRHTQTSSSFCVASIAGRKTGPSAAHTGHLLFDPTLNVHRQVKGWTSCLKINNKKKNTWECNIH